MGSFRLIIFTVLLLALAPASAASAVDGALKWKSDWAAANEYFSVSVDSRGFHFPTAIAFVPKPGPGPKDPLYFVTELRGSVKVVTNDRSVYTFAEDFFEFKPREELPYGFEGQSGLAGLCLAPERGYVFVTFIYRDGDDVLRNNIVRFDTQPETFALRPESQLAFTEVFSSEKTGVTHQIGHCQVNDDLLYVGVGDGWQPIRSQRLDSVLGKVLRMTLDGKPVESNPFYVDEDIKKPANYVWAYGFRNPFGLAIINDRLFAAENGLNMDRFLEVQSGENYLWNGSDWSIGTNAGVVFAPAVSPVQIDHGSTSPSALPAKYEEYFFAAVSSNFALPADQRYLQSRPGVLMFKYDLDKNRILSVPEYLLRYRGTEPQSVAGLAFGPDGLYLAPLFPNGEGESAILKVDYAPNNKYPFTLSEDKSPDTLLLDKGCLGCHSLDGIGGTAGPSLDRAPMLARIENRLGSEEYLQSLAELDRLKEPPFQEFKAARHEVATADGAEKIRAWMKYHLQEPLFDNPNSQMPNMGLSEREALIITDYLLTKEEKSEEPDWVKRIHKGFGPPRYRHLVLFLIGGFVMGLATLTGIRQIRKG